MRAKYFSVKLGLPFGLGEVQGVWEPDEAQRLGAWELYVELATRVGTSGLGAAEGSLREALNSLHSIFPATREVLRRYGPSVARAKPEDGLSLGLIAVTLLNGVLRPFLSIWHPELAAYEGTRPAATSTIEHERAWKRGPEMRDAFAQVALAIDEYNDLLARVAGVPLLCPPREDA